ncbi:MAG: M28 family metallopeptidase, partial [Syntrophobacteraceae bacterium]
MADRSTGSAGAELTADFISKSLGASGVDAVGVQEFQTPVPVSENAILEADGRQFELAPWGPNLVHPSTTSQEGIHGSLVYVGQGGFAEFDGKHLRGSIVLMEMRSGKNWLNAASFGASAVVFLGSPGSNREDFEQKNTTAPLAFPRFWVDAETGRKLRELERRGEKARIWAKSSWKISSVRNCYGFIRGTDEQLQNELVILEAPYDAYPFVLGRAPGADEAVSAAILLETAKLLGREKPERSVLFLFTAGNRDELAGTRHFMSGLSASDKEVRRQSQAILRSKASLEKKLELALRSNPLETSGPDERELISQIIADKAKDRADEISRQHGSEKPREVALELRSLRAIAWGGLSEPSPLEKSIISGLVTEAAEDLRASVREAGLRANSVKDAGEIRNLIGGLKTVLFLSLDLSPSSPRLGIVENGATYPIRENILRVTRAGRLGRLVEKVGGEVSRAYDVPDLLGEGASSEDTATLSSVFRYGSDVAAIGGLPAVALVSEGDGHLLRSTPLDTSENLDKNGFELLRRFTPPLVSALVSNPLLRNAVQPGISGFSNLSGQAMYIRGGELFPDQPAPGTIISVFQGRSLFRTVVNLDGTFFVPGLANNRVAIEKAIIEAYRPDPATGKITSTVDRVRTGKDNYRVRVKSGSVASSLVMFRCEQTDVLPVLNPGNMGHLTRVEVFDARTDSVPMRYWSSRMDGRDNMALSIFLEKGTRFKLAVSESLLGKDFLLLNSDPETVSGCGFLIGEPAVITNAGLQTATDLYYLAGSRLSALSNHGIVNQMLESLYRSSAVDLEAARGHLAEGRYSMYWKKIIPAWAKLDVVYKEIDRDQRDVLGGVIFFIALFIPFAYCMERYLFCFRDVYRQITAFLLILISTILLIRALHPAFQLTYSPMVVILAFFIVGLSLAVSWIIFMRFEREMARGHGIHQGGMQHVTKWQAFGAGFSIGVSNLNRRKMRTALTCATLVILTFTIMSFTNVKSSFRTIRTRIADAASYQGFLIR